MDKIREYSFGVQSLVLSVYYLRISMCGNSDRMYSGVSEIYKMFNVGFFPFRMFYFIMADVQKSVLKVDKEPWDKSSTVYMHSKSLQPSQIIVKKLIMKYKLP